MTLYFANLKDVLAHAVSTLSVECRLCILYDFIIFLAVHLSKIALCYQRLLFIQVLKSMNPSCEA